MFYSLRPAAVALPILTILAAAAPPKPPAAVKMLDIFDRLQSAQQKKSAQRPDFLQSER